MANESKKFALLCCCLMTMQALRLVISTAGFCVTRFHIDCTLFNIFISRLVNAVLMSQLFGNWLGDLIVFAASGHVKLYAAALANWAELMCFCFALICFCESEQGMLTGFYWSMVLAYFWWKVGEAPATSIAPLDGSDYYFAGFTLSGVWAACLKGLVMRCVADDAKTAHFNSIRLSDVNVSVVGRRSVKTTVDYRAAKWLFAITIVLTALMCLSWTAIAMAQKDWGVTETEEVVKDAADVKEWNAAIQNVETAGLEETWNLSSARVQNGGVQKDESKNQVTFTVKGVPNGQTLAGNATDAKKVGIRSKEELEDASGGGSIQSVEVTAGTDKNQIEITVTVGTSLGIKENNVVALVALLVGFAFGGVLAVPGAMMGVGVGFSFAKICRLGQKKCQLIFSIVGGTVGIITGCSAIMGTSGKKKKEVWVVHFKKDGKAGDLVTWAPVIGLVGGLVLGALVGYKPSLGRSEGNKATTPGGALVGSFLGLLTGEIVNGCLTWDTSTPFMKDENGQDKRTWWVVVCGMLIVVLGLGTVYSIYPGMAPCSITQFQYFNLIDILILILSSIGPLVTMGLDLGKTRWRLAKKIAKAFKDGLDAGGVWMTTGLVLLISTNICEIIVLDIMQHPFSKMAQKVTTSGWRAVLLTVTMVTSQLVSTGVGFGSVAAGSGFNDGFMNVNSTAVLWTTECCGVLGEGYLTELKKYEPGKWPTQGMGKWATYKWWNRKAFGNAWAIWCCIGTTDLRRDIMLCRQ